MFNFKTKVKHITITKIILLPRKQTENEFSRHRCLVRLTNGITGKRDDLSYLLSP